MCSSSTKIHLRIVFPTNIESTHTHTHHMVIVYLLTKASRLMTAIYNEQEMKLKAMTHTKNGIHSDPNRSWITHWLLLNVSVSVLIRSLKKNSKPRPHVWRLPSKCILHLLNSDLHATMDYDYTTSIICMANDFVIVYCCSYFYVFVGVCVCVFVWKRGDNNDWFLRVLSLSFFILVDPTSIH